MKKLLKKALKMVLPIALGGGILVWTYRDFEFWRVKEVLLHEMNWWWMILSLFFGIFSHLFRGWRWKLALTPLGTPPRTVTAINAIFISYAANLVLPRVGEVSRCAILSKYDGISFSKSLGTVVTERMIDTLCVALLTGIAMMGQMKVVGQFFGKTGTNLHSIGDLFTSVQFYIIAFSVIGVIILLYYLARTLSFFEKVKGVVVNIWEGVISLKKTKNIPVYLFYTFAIWFCYFMQFYITFFCFSFTQDLNIWAGLVLFVAGTFAVVVPTPNGAGPWHFAVITMLTLYGVNETDAGVFALLVHSIQTLLVIILGIYALIALSTVNKLNTL
ncbi:lysylphosphatidylglycerol synthase transmembrane domain-containing protein [Bacteroides sp. 224]|uniref:lysylphosphatidylglycerol synthase transmembrane domain-containing protein n=1 Tax=Bacteroides sp. 224 TaxID=2302936 RepID=UPI0013D16B72|nr:lysylphosphatidylglycerol synthase transmembrane domain-containing protein [Bacteroides sp. 224]NDV65560.1 UPF0104 family protein [Bacteroides sp. 224]